MQLGGAAEGRERLLPGLPAERCHPESLDPAALLAWGRIEHAKKRLLYTLFELGLPVESRQEREGGLVFSFKESDAKSASPVLTGHDDGRITLNIAEADNPGRERLREQLGEAYRTLLGHFRHEIGHYYWDVLIRDTDRAGPVPRSLRRSHQGLRGGARTPLRDGGPSGLADVLRQHLRDDAPVGGLGRDVGPLPSHRGHARHGAKLRIEVKPEPIGLLPPPKNLKVNTRRVDFEDFDDLVAAWIPLTVALNSLNRAMGLQDIYPFVLSERAIQKLRFVHDVIELAHAPRA